MTYRLRIATGLLLALAFSVAATKVRADRRPRPPAGPGTVNLPYVVNDNTGNQWMIYQGGWMRQNGNMPLYSQAAMVLLNGNAVASGANTAARDEKTGEIIFVDMPIAGGVTMTRRILVNAAEGYVRYIDVLKNAQPQEQSVNVMWQTNFNYGVQTSAMVKDPKKKDRDIAWVAQLQAGRALMEVYGGRGAKNVPEITYMPDNNMVRAAHQITIPGGKQVALVHLHGAANTQEAAQQFVTSIKDSKLLADVPPDIRRIIVNFGGGSAYIDGDREVLRGELFDVVELRTGDLVKGTLKDSSYKLQTFYGNVELPADRVVGLMNVGQFRPRQLVVTSDGEVFGGRLAKESIDLELSSGQSTQIPLTQIARIGYRKRPGEPEEWTFERPLVMLRTGERVGVAAPDRPVEVLTRYGLLKLAPQSILAIDFQAEEHGVHEIYLTDGSAFAGLVNAPTFEMKLAGPGAQPVSFPSSALRRLQMTSKAPETDADETPTLQLANEDLLVGTLTGRLKLDTTFDTIDVDAAEIRALARAPEAAGLDVQVTLWDQTTVSGQLQQPQVVCALGSGVQVTVPIALVEEYSNPNPKPSATMVERIKAVVAQLSADDWKAREAAEAQLAGMGPTVASVLRDMLPTQPPEAQQRIESILKQLGKKAAAPQPMPLVPQE
jgi:hypothetical protein